MSLRLLPGEPLPSRVAQDVGKLRMEAKSELAVALKDRDQHVANVTKLSNEIQRLIPQTQVKEDAVTMARTKYTVAAQDAGLACGRSRSCRSWQALPPPASTGGVFG